MNYTYYISILAVFSLASCENNTRRGITGNNNNNNNVIIADTYIQSKSLPIYQRLEDEYFSRDHIGRFGGAYSYPNTWTRFESENQDGCTITNPINDSIQILAFGSYYDENINGDYSIKNFISENSKVVYIRSAQIPEKELLNIDGQTINSIYMVDASQAVWIDQSKNIQFIGIGAVQSGRELTILCSAPLNDFKNYEDLFLKVVSSGAFLKGQ